MPWRRKAVYYRYWRDPAMEKLRSKGREDGRRSRRTWRVSESLKLILYDGLLLGCAAAKRRGAARLERCVELDRRRSGRARTRVSRPRVVKRARELLRVMGVEKRRAAAGGQRAHQDGLS